MSRTGDREHFSPLHPLCLILLRRGRQEVHNRASRMGSMSGRLDPRPLPAATVRGDPLASGRGRRADASHRCGNPDFDRFLGKNMLEFPDHFGNPMFDALGNIVCNSSVGQTVPARTRLANARA